MPTTLTHKPHPDYGRPGPRTSAGMADLWRTAADLNARFPGRGEWVPWRAVWVRPEIMPRAAEPDPDVVAQYADVFDLLPPVRVQRDTFVLVDGWHRLRAARVATRDHIRIVEVDVADDDIEDEACRANVAHGLPLSADERRKAAQRMYARHHPDTGGTTGDAWTTGRIAGWSGCHRNTINEWLARDRQKAHEAAERAAALSHVAQNVQPERTINRLGVDDKVYEQRIERPATGAAAAPRTGQRRSQHRDWLDVFRQILDCSPRDVAEDVPDEAVPEQRQQALRMVRWWEGYAAALDERA